MDASWAVHQVRTTSNFSRGNRLLTWMLGGLNHQIEHHLFPQIGHVHYPALAQVVEQTCRKRAIQYREHDSFAAGVRAHYRWLKRMGRATP
jgi:linoleoyl-CoA desaturase